MRCASAVAGLIALIEVFRPAFTRPSFEKCRQLAGLAPDPGAADGHGRHRGSGPGWRRHHVAWHRFFSTARWSADEPDLSVLQQILAHFVERRAAGGRLSRRHVGAEERAAGWGIGNHIDAVRSSVAPRCSASPRLGGPVRGRAALFSHRRGHSWCLPAVPEQEDGQGRRRGPPQEDRTGPRVDPNCRLRSERDGSGCSATAPTAAPKSGRTAYCNSVLVGAMRHDAALTTLPDPAPATAEVASSPGPRLPTPAQMAQDEGIPWRPATVRIYGRTNRRVQDGRRAMVPRLPRLAAPGGHCPRDDGRNRACRVTSPDATMSPEEILQAYASGGPSRSPATSSSTPASPTPRTGRGPQSGRNALGGPPSPSPSSGTTAFGHGSAFDWGPAAPLVPPAPKPLFPGGPRDGASGCVGIVDPIVLVHFGNKSGGSPLAEDRAPPPTASSSRCAA